MADLAPAQTQNPAPAATTDAGSRAQRIFNHVPKNRRLILAAAGMLMLAGFFALMFWSAQPEYRLLYGGLSDTEASQVVEALQQDHISYRLQGGGNVLVPADELYSARLRLAGQGAAPTGGVGFELFDKSQGFGLSEFAQQVNYQRALQGELARTIEVLPQVAAARIHLALPKKSAFIERQRPASASVLVKIIGGQRLPKETVRAIQNLVASSVPQLESEAVTVVDSAGNLLSGSDEEEPMSTGQTLNEHQNNIERHLEARLTGMLEQMVGSGQAVVRVTADLDREQVEQERHQFNPDEVAIRSERETTENRAARESTPSGVPGITANTPGQNGAQAGITATPGEEANRSERVINYEISTLTEHRVIPYGGIKRLSVAVVVGGQMQQTEGKQQFVPRDKQELKAIEALVQKAIGFNEERGDSVEVQSLPLVDIRDNVDTEAINAAERKAFYLQAARYGVAALALFLIAWFVLRPLARRISTPQPATNAPTAEAIASTHMLPQSSLQHLEVQSAAKTLVAENPDRAAKILRQWTNRT